MNIFPQKINKGFFFNLLKSFSIDSLFVLVIAILLSRLGIVLSNFIFAIKFAFDNFALKLSAAKLSNF